MADIIKRLFESDEASALTNEAAREITRLTTELDEARAEALEKAAQWHDKKADERRVRNNGVQALYHHMCAAAIRNLAKQETGDG